MRRVAFMLFLLTSLLAVGLTPGVFSGTAGAVPPRCEDGSPPPCNEPDPDPDPIPPPTTRPPPPTTTPPPPGPWMVNVLSLLDDEAPLTGAVEATRYWLPPIVFTPNGFLPPPPTVFDPIEAGNATLVNGKLTFPYVPMPNGYDMVLRVREAGSSGALCRTAARTGLPPSGRPLHMLTAPPLETTAAELQAMVSGFVGPVTGLDPGVAVDVTSVTLTPQANGLQLRTQGKLVLDPFRFTFDHTMLLTLVPSTGPDLRSVLYATAANAGTATVAWDQVPPPPPDGDNILALVGGALPSRLRSPILLRATTSVNERIHGLHAVQWWHDQGFNVSVRSVRYAPTGLTVLPALCRLG